MSLVSLVEKREQVVTDESEEVALDREGPASYAQKFRILFPGIQGWLRVLVGEPT